jgi:hypothetical protein
VENSSLSVFIFFGSVSLEIAPVVIGTRAKLLPITFIENFLRSQCAFKLYWTLKFSIIHALLDFEGCIWLRRQKTKALGIKTQMNMIQDANPI